MGTRLSYAPMSFVLASALTLSAAPAAHAQGNWTWRSVRIDGMGFVTGLLIAPEAPYDVYAKTDVGGAYRFDRAALRWIPLMDNFPQREQRALDVAAFALVPGVRGGLVVVGDREHPTDLNEFGGREAYGDVWRTEDFGATWTPLGLVSERVRVSGNGEYRGFTGERIAVDPLDVERMVVASRLDGAWLRDPGGAWSRAAGLPTVAPWVDPNDPSNGSYAKNTPGHTFVLFDPSGGALAGGAQSARLYLGDHATGVWRSDDGGASWTLVPGSPQHAARASIARDGTLYVSCVLQASGPNVGGSESGSIWRLDPGVGWSEITPLAQGSTQVRSRVPYAEVAINPTNPAILAAGPSSGNLRYVSFDRGATWTSKEMGPIANLSPYAPPPTPENYFIEPEDWGNCVMVFDPAAPRSLWNQNGYGVVRCRSIFAQNPGYRWEMRNLEELVMHNVLCPPVPFADGGAEAISACMDMTGFRHADLDEVPLDRIARPLAIGSGTGIAYCASEPASIVQVGWDHWQPWRTLTGVSRDNGRTWTPFADESPGVGGRVAVSATDPNRIVWEPSTWRKVVVSTDGGATWAEAIDLDATPDPNNPEWNRLGWAFHVSNPWWQGQHLVADRVDGARFYRFTWGQCHYSEDGGATWRRGFNAWTAATSPPMPAYAINTRLVPHPTRAGEVWISCMPNPGEDASGLFRTLDGGRTVEVVPTVAEATHVAFGLGASAAEPAVYIIGRPVGATQFGAWMSLDGGLSWTLISDPSELAFNKVAAIDGDMRVFGRLLVATSGRGLMVGER